MSQSKRFLSASSTASLRYSFKSSSSYSIMTSSYTPTILTRHTPLSFPVSSRRSFLTLSSPNFGGRIDFAAMGTKRQSKNMKYRRHWVRANRESFHSAKRANDALRNEHFLSPNKEPSVPNNLKAHNLPAWYDLTKIMAIEVGDLVQVLYGRDMGKQGVVRKIFRKKNCLTVHGLNMKKAFRVDTKDRRLGSVITSVEMPMHVTNVMLVDPVTKKPTRVKRRYTMFGECVRVSKISGSAMPRPVRIKKETREKLAEMHEKELKIEKQYRGVAKDEWDRRHYKMLAKMAMGGGKDMGNRGGGMPREI